MKIGWSVEFALKCPELKSCQHASLFLEKTHDFVYQTISFPMHLHSSKTDIYLTITRSVSFSMDIDME